MRLRERGEVGKEMRNGKERGEREEDDNSEREEEEKDKGEDGR